eukprot:5499343-Amphidinium_carterae.1
MGLATCAVLGSLRRLSEVLRNARRHCYHVLLHNSFHAAMQKRSPTSSKYSHATTLLQSFASTGQLTMTMLPMLFIVTGVRQRNQSTSQV